MGDTKIEKVQKSRIKNNNKNSARHQEKISSLR